jgi:hypothetical protein
MNKEEAPDASAGAYVRRERKVNPIRVAELRSPELYDQRNTREAALVIALAGSSGGDRAKREGGAHTI